MNNFNKFLDEYYFCRKLNTRIYRLLGNYKKYIYSYIGDLELNIPYNTKKKNEKLLTIDNDKLDKEKRETLHRCLLYKEKLIKRLMKNKCTMLHKSYNHYEKKIMNGLDDKYFFKKMILINDMDYKKLKRKKYKLRIFLLLLLFILVLSIPIIDLSLGNFKDIGGLLNKLCSLLGYTGNQAEASGSTLDGFNGFLSSTCKLKNFTGIRIFGILMYCLPILIMGILIIRGIFYYYNNVIKHKKIKFLEEFNEW
ncbi:Plasmodium exported protein (Pm-fam-a like), unknown function [Plasmodium malariae]|uniref:Fam-l protein n=1 Tax=Plasmodium malariae TaxID=5858 RepID=A0A1A8WNJ8_PLAMA|nr:Plasmodium exported protein (Pm-fam-a like), unknown function [Plasmodium malariae]